MRKVHAADEVPPNYPFSGTSIRRAQASARVKVAYQTSNAIRRLRGSSVTCAALQGFVVWHPARRIRLNQSSLRRIQWANAHSTLGNISFVSRSVELCGNRRIAKSHKGCEPPRGIMVAASCPGTEERVDMAFRPGKNGVDGSDVELAVLAQDVIPAMSMKLLPLKNENHILYYR